MTTRLLAIYLAVTLHMFLNPALRPMDAQVCGRWTRKPGERAARAADRRSCRQRRVGGDVSVGHRPSCLITGPHGSSTTKTATRTHHGNRSPSCSARVVLVQPRIGQAADRSGWAIPDSVTSGRRSRPRRNKPRRHRSDAGDNRRTPGSRRNNAAMAISLSSRARGAPRQ
jgi:hypothetical protein